MNGAFSGLLGFARLPLRAGGAPRTRWRALMAAALLGIAAAAAGGELAGGALRALGIVVLLGVGTAAITAGRRRASLPTLVRLEERHLLARDAGVAVVDVAGQRLLVGFGTSGVALLSRLRDTSLPCLPPGRGKAGRGEKAGEP